MKKKGDPEGLEVDMSPPGPDLRFTIVVQQHPSNELFMVYQLLIGAKKIFLPSGSCSEGGLSNLNFQAVSKRILVMAF